MRTVLPLLLLTVVVGCQQRPAVIAGRGSCRTVSLPVLALEKDQRVSSIRLELVGGSFCAVNRIPADFFAEVEPPISGKSTLHMSANHGLFWLPNTKKLQQFATVVVDDEQRFAVSAGVEISTRDGERQIALEQEDLVLREVERR